jgi:nucleoside-diphosphate kinase
MAVERTLAIIKPDAVAKGYAGRILSRVATSGLALRAMRMENLDKARAEGFYAIHKSRPFFPSLCDFMSSGPCIVMVLEGEGAIQKWRELMGPTDPAKAPKDSIRAEFGESIERNATHGSDAPETAAFEVSYFFRGSELL